MPYPPGSTRSLTTSSSYHPHHHPSPPPHHDPPPQPWPRLLHKSVALPSSSPKRRCKHTALRVIPPMSLSRVEPQKKGPLDTFHGKLICKIIGKYNYSNGTYGYEQVSHETKPLTFDYIYFTYILLVVQKGDPYVMVYDTVVFHPLCSLNNPIFSLLSWICKTSRCTLW